jgi:hypothetical protein
MLKISASLSPLFLSLALAACGGQAPAPGKSAARPSAGAAPTGGAAADPAAPAGAADDDHPCRRPIERPAEVWDRIETVRALGEEERTRECGLGLVEILARWRVAPVDLLGPVVERAAADEERFAAWVRQRAADNPEAVASAVAMDVVRVWQIGADPAAVTDRAAHWRSALEGNVPQPVAAVLDGAAALPPLLERVNELHRLRCLLEINPLGFAIQCVPIHPSGRPIVLSWKTAIRDGLIESLEVTECKGRSCKKIRKTAAKLMEHYRALVADIEKLDNEVFREQLKVWLELPPFKSISA